MRFVVDVNLPPRLCGMLHGHNHEAVQASGKFFVVINDDESDAFDNNAGFLFSPDGRHVVYSGYRNTRPPTFPVYIDGKAEQPSQGLALDTFTFSPDMSRHAYFIGSPGLGTGTGPVFLDDKDSGLNGNFTFSPDSKHIAVAGYRPADNKRGLFVDGQQVYSTDRGVSYRAFTPDGQHLFWMTLEEAKSKEPGAFETVTYLDGKAVVRCDRIDAGAGALIYNAGTGVFIKPPPAWEVGSDGVLTFLGPVGEVVKRFKVTPSSDTSVVTMLANATK